MDGTQTNNIKVSNFFQIIAQITVKIREKIKKYLNQNEKNLAIHQLFSEFKKYIPKIDTNSFANDFAQVLTFIFLNLKIRQKNNFNPNNLSLISSIANPILKLIYGFLRQIDKLDTIGIDELINFLKTITIDEILHNFRQQEAERDPILYFYELFLKEYDPNQRITRGVFYTPNPIASFIVRSVDYLLRAELNSTDGLMNYIQSPNQILDPATGTGTFLIHIIDIIKQAFNKKYSHLDETQALKQWNEYVSNYILPNIYGYEVMLTPFIIAHLNIGSKLAETGYIFKSNQSINLDLCNAFEKNTSTNQFAVIIGNPPYQVNSINKTVKIQDLMQLYKAGVKDERYIKPLSDDYIKFTRLAHHLIDHNGFGIIAMITNHGYLSGLIHRGMREELLRSFDKIYILDLHGNSNIGETCPDGSQDQNIFDIQQGVAISFFVKLPNPLPHPEVYHIDLWGIQDDKYQFLTDNDISTLSWNKIQPYTPYFLFIPYNTRLAEEYNSYISLKDIFKLQRIGILTNRDWLTIDFSEGELKRKIQQFFDLIDTPELLETFPQLADTWWDYQKLTNLNLQNVFKSITKCLFRPFDIRYIVYHPLLLNRARKEVMDHINGKENLVLITSRHSRKDQFNSCFISQYVVEQKAGESTRGSYVFPTYIYNNEVKQSNLTTLIKECFKSLNIQISDYALIGYIYAILHSKSYRIRYQEYLRLDFPRIPLTKNKELFLQLASLGCKLIEFHLLKHAETNEFELCGHGNNLIERGFPQFKENSIYINSSQWFPGISSAIWAFIVGGYQVCQKWLKDRKGRMLERHDILFYQKIVRALSETIQIMDDIDKTIGLYGGWPLK